MYRNIMYTTNHCDLGKKKNVLNHVHHYETFYKNIYDEMKMIDDSPFSTILQLNVNLQYSNNQNKGILMLVGVIRSNPVSIHVNIKS